MKKYILPLGPFVAVCLGSLALFAIQGGLWELKRYFTNTVSPLSCTLQEWTKGSRGNLRAIVHCGAYKGHSEDVATLLLFVKKTTVAPCTLYPSKKVYCVGEGKRS